MYYEYGFVVFVRDKRKQNHHHFSYMCIGNSSYLFLKCDIKKCFFHFSKTIFTPKCVFVITNYYVEQASHHSFTKQNRSFFRRWFQHMNVIEKTRREKKENRLKYLKEMEERSHTFKQKMKNKTDFVWKYWKVLNSHKSPFLLSCYNISNESLHICFNKQINYIRSRTRNFNAIKKWFCFLLL